MTSSSSSSVDLGVEIPDAICAVLLANGITPSRDLVNALAEKIDGLGHVQSARHMGRMFSRLPATPGGESVYRFLMFDRESITSVARRIDCSPSSLLRAERAFRRFIGIKEQVNPNSGSPVKPAE